MKNQTVLITGASSGIGEAYAYAFGKRGYNLILVARRENLLQEIKAKIEEEHHVFVEIIAQDLSLTNSAQDLYNIILKKNLMVDILINNAGFGLRGPFENSDLQQIDNLLMVNIKALTDLTYLFLKDMKSRNSGTIINVASINSFFSLPYSAVYAASKAFVLSLSQALYVENRHNNIQILAVCPGNTDTGFFDNLEQSAAKGMVETRSSEDVVKTTFKALDKNKMFCIDGSRNRFMVQFPRILTRKRVTIITGSADEKIYRK